MLDRYDRRRLEDIERRLESEDPELARCLTHWRRPAPTRTATVLAHVATLISTLGVVAGLLLLSPGLLVVFGAALVLSWRWVRRDGGRRDGGRRDGLGEAADGGP